MIPSKTLRNLGLLYLTVLGLILTLGSFVQARSFSLGLILTEVVCILLPALAYLRLTRAPRTSLRLSLPAWPLMLACLPLGLGLWLVDSALDSLLAALFGYSILLPAGAYPTTPGQAALVLIALAVFAPLCEEVLFRGVILRAVEPFGARAAIVLTSLLFAFFHFRLQGLIALLPAAFLLSYAAWRSGSLLVSILVHIVNNAAAAAVLIYTAARPGQPLPLAFGAMIALGVVLLAAGLWLLKRFSPVIDPLPPPAAVPTKLPLPKKQTRSRATAPHPLTRAGTLWPLALSALLYLALATAEWVSQKQPALLAAGRSLTLATLRDPNAGHYRFDVTNIVGDAVGHANYQVISMAGQLALVGSEQIQSFEVQYQGGTWLSSGYSKTWTSQPVADIQSDSFEWQFKTGEELYTASSDGATASIRFGQRAAFTLETAGTALLEEGLLLRCMGMPFEHGESRLVNVVRLAPAREDTKLEEMPLVVTVLGGEPIHVPAGDFIAWRVKIGPNLTAWYDRETPHRLLRYQSTGVTYSLR